MTTTQTQPIQLASARGRLVLTLLCSIAFLDFVDGVIVNVALPSIRRDLDFTVEGLQWVPSGYLLTYGGFMLLGGRAADLIGRRRVLIAGTCVFGAASLVGGLAGTADLLIGARIVQGAGAAMMMPAALSTLTTMYADGPDRYKAFGAWGAVTGLASAAGVLLGGLLTEGSGWRSVLLVNPPLCVLVLVAIVWLLPADGPAHRTIRLDVRGALLCTGGMLALVYAIVEAPSNGWASAETLITMACALGLIAAFVINERQSSDPLLPLSLFRVRGLSAANATQLIGIAGFIAMFFFVTLYMQDVLGYSPIESGLAYLPVCAGVAVSAAIASQLVTKVGTRPVIVVGALVAGGGVMLLSRVPVDGTYATDLLPGLLVLAIGLGPVFVAVTTAANSGVSADRAGAAAALLNASQQLGAALGLAIFTAIATSRTNDLLASGAAPVDATTSGFERALLISGLTIIVAAAIGTRAVNARTKET